MIILEFRSQDLFQNASEILKKHRLPCISEVAMEAWRSNYIFLFEDAVRTGPQREALRQARSLEMDDHRQRKIHRELNLAVPL